MEDWNGIYVLSLECLDTCFYRCKTKANREKSARNRTIVKGQPKQPREKRSPMVVATTTGSPWWSPRSVAPPAGWWCLATTLSCFPNALFRATFWSAAFALDLPTWAYWTSFTTFLDPFCLNNFF